MKTADSGTPEGEPDGWVHSAQAIPPSQIPILPPLPAPSSDRRASSLPLILSSVALAATLTAPYWSPPLYRLFRLQPAGLEWQARQEVETGRLARSVAELDRKVSELTATLAKSTEQGASANAVIANTDARIRVVALLQLRATLRRPVPFDAELKAVRALGGKLDELEPLLTAVEAYAANGIPVESQLRQDFAAVTDAAGRADPRPLPVKWLSNVTGWSPVAVEPEAVRPAMIAEQAQALLAEGNLPGAMAQLNALDLASTGPARGWMEDARARIAANQAIDRIAEMVVTSVGRIAPKS
ncbi:COG4223 family protein [Azospirillum sp. B510]|uniref:COG4223 family protein n=1 Tax=Azospirillum sp. (strain B510) TaxID=137722 RepID=UPI0011D0913E|nr:hypothetical protein [Azospirillum sp. B510]